jgi:hypothetical protein
VPPHCPLPSLLSSDVSSIAPFFLPSLYEHVVSSLPLSLPHLNSPHPTSASTVFFYSPSAVMASVHFSLYLFLSSSALGCLPRHHTTSLPLLLQITTVHKHPAAGPSSTFPLTPTRLLTPLPILPPILPPLLVLTSRLSNTSLRPSSAPFRSPLRSNFPVRFALPQEPSLESASSLLSHPGKFDKEEVVASILQAGGSVFEAQLIAASSRVIGSSSSLPNRRAFLRKKSVQFLLSSRSAPRSLVLIICFFLLAAPRARLYSIYILPSSHPTVPKPSTSRFSTSRALPSDSAPYLRSTHLILDKGSSANLLPPFVPSFTPSKSAPAMVTMEWIKSCLKEGTLQDTPKQAMLSMDSVQGSIVGHRSSRNKGYGVVGVGFLFCCHLSIFMFSSFLSLPNTFCGGVSSQEVGCCPSRCVSPHTDPSDPRLMFGTMSPFEDIKGSQLALPPVGLVSEYFLGEVVLLRARLVRHAVLAFDSSSFSFSSF